MVHRVCPQNDHVSSSSHSPHLQSRSRYYDKYLADIAEAFFGAQFVVLTLLVLISLQVLIPHPPLSHSQAMINILLRRYWIHLFLAASPIPSVTCRVFLRIQEPQQLHGLEKQEGYTTVDTITSQIHMFLVFGELVVAEFFPVLRFK